MKIRRPKPNSWLWAAALAAVNLARFARDSRVWLRVGDAEALGPLPAGDLPPMDAVVGNLPYVRLHRQPDHLPAEDVSCG